LSTPKSKGHPTARTWQHASKEILNREQWIIDMNVYSHQVMVWKGVVKAMVKENKPLDPTDT
jgi:hypothetical protein